MFIAVLVLVPTFTLAISNKNVSEYFSEALLDLSNVAIQGRQNYQQYDPADKYPQYYQHYKPYKYPYGYRPQYLPDYSTNQISNPSIKYDPSSYFTYPGQPFRKPQLVQNTQQSVMDALFSIAQNDDLQCVPKLMCEITSGGLTGRQNGLGLPVNINLESLTALLSGLNSANMSPVLHFGKAVILGFASKGNSRSCRYAYPECPSDPDKLVQYLNNHNGGFFRFFQKINSANPYNYPQNYAQYFNNYRPGYFGKSGLAEKRIQTRPSEFPNGYAYYKEHRQLSFPQTSTFTLQSHNNFVGNDVIFPQDQKYNYIDISTPGSKALKFPIDDTDPYRRGKKLQFESYLNNIDSNNNDNFLDIQRPLPNHVPTPNIFPDRTGTGELKLDLNELEHNYQQSLAYDFDEYTKLLYDSFPNDAANKPPRLSFPNK